MFAGTGDVDDAALEDVGVELQRLREEQRRLPESLLTLLHEANTAHLEHAQRRATAELDGKKSLIDQQLGTMTDELGKVGELVRGLDADRRKAYGELANELQRQHEGLNALTEHTRQLREALASQKVRGQWGERMAEDVLAPRRTPRRRQLPPASNVGRERPAAPTTRSCCRTTS